MVADRGDRAQSQRVEECKDGRSASNQGDKQKGPGDARPFR